MNWASETLTRQGGWASGFYGALEEEGGEVSIRIEVFHMILCSLTRLIAYLLELARRISEKIAAHYFLGGRSKGA